MIDAVQTRSLSSGEVLVYPASLKHLIVVGRERAHLVGAGPGAWTVAEALVGSGEARRFEGDEMQQITASFRAVGLLLDHPPFSPA